MAPDTTAAEPDAGSPPADDAGGAPTGFDIALVIGLGFALWGLSIGLGRLGDNSFFTHLATGRLIIEGGIPRTDPYSYTAVGTPWVVQSWLASWLYGWVDSWFGPQGIRVLMGLTSALLAWLVWRLTAPARTLIGRIAICGLVVGIGATVWSARPLLVGLVALCIVLLAAEGRVPPWALLPVMWIWANAHGSFPLGLVALAALALGRRLDGESPSVELRALAWAAGGTLLAALNPLGPTILTFPAHLLQRQDVLREIIEWKSPSFSDLWSRLFLVQVMIAVLALVRRPSYRAAVPLVVFTAAALLGARNVSVASIVLVPGMARGLADIGSLTGREKGTVARVGVVLVLLASLVVARSALDRPAFDLTTFPVDAVAWMNQEGWRDPSINVATQDTVGNYLELVYGTDARAFLDDRVDMYPKDLVTDFVTLLHGTPGWQAVLERRQVDVVLWGANEPLVQLLSGDPSWRVLYTDGSWVVACNRASTAIQERAAGGGPTC